MWFVHSSEMLLHVFMGINPTPPPPCSLTNDPHPATTLKFKILGYYLENIPCKNNTNEPFPASGISDLSPDLLALQSHCIPESDSLPFPMLRGKVLTVPVDYYHCWE